MIEKTVWQDEKDFTLDDPVNLHNGRVYRKGKKSDVPDENLFAFTKKMSRNVMISSLITWYGSMKLCFVNENGIKSNKDHYCKHLKNSCFLQLKNLLSVTTGYLCKIVLRHIDRILYKIYLKNF